MFKIYILTVFILVCVSVVRCDLNKSEGDACEWEGVQGKCVSPRVCLTTLATREEKHPVCSQNGGETLICCTDCQLVNDTSNAVISPTGGILWKDGRVFRDKCLEYLKDLPHTCQQEGFYGGISRGLNAEKKCHTHGIWGIGGSPPIGLEPPSENPYEALMGFGKDLESAVWVTSGAIISEKFILTSANGHTTTNGRIPLKFAALGVKNRKDDKKNWQIHGIKKIYQHPKYDGGNTRYNDIALLELDTPITFNKDVQPACLPDPRVNFDAQEAKVSSWKEMGMDFNTTRDTPNIMQVEKLTAKQCHDKIRENESPIPIFFPRFLPKGINSTSQICYGNKDTCLHIIGSPIVVNTYLSRCMNTVIGVNAYGDTCGPVIYTKVAQYLSWIESIVWP